MLRRLHPLLLLAALAGSAQAAPFSYDPVSFAGYANQVFKRNGEGIFVRNLGTCLARCDLEVEELVSAPFAAGLATLVEDEKRIGATVIDMGGGAPEGHRVKAVQTGGPPWFSTRISTPPIAATAASASLSISAPEETSA